jgi:serine O-acetyltransferase
MENFIDKLYKHHKEKTVLPSQILVNTFLDTLLSIMFPTFNNKYFISKDKLEEEIQKNKEQLHHLLLHLTDVFEGDIENVITSFYEKLPLIYNALLLDAEAIELGDPAATNRDEVMRAYPGFYAISIYRIAHLLYELKVPFIPRILTERAHSKTGIDIHPGAKIGNSFFIDHGTGIVIGETTIIGDNVKLYQGVTLGALSVKKELADSKRHPTIENSVVIYAGATILGGRTVIGENSTIGGNVWLTHSVKSNSLVYQNVDITIDEKK